jgi:hypothetical protein
MKLSLPKALKPFPENKYSEIISEVGKYRYKIFSEGEQIPGGLFQRNFNISNYNCVVAGTGDTLSPFYIDITATLRPIVVPADTPVVVVRLLRYDDAHGKPHFNADDQLIFASEDGSVWRLPRKDAPDHFIQIANTANLLTVADAYQLPDAKEGEVNQYSAKGAKLHINLKPVNASK